MHAFLIVDIDNFKSVNDNLGHVFGDKVLFEVSKNLKPIFRKDDIVGRIGGDEFIVFLKNIQSFENIKKKAEYAIYLEILIQKIKRHIKYLEQLEFHLYQNMELYLKNFIKKQT
ncbi:diguanylate cyclase domain protein [Clostridioides difficile DA00165]|nr:diguanylate cyclase domain protein [Clostridioides difficile DA00165]